MIPVSLRRQLMELCGLTYRRRNMNIFLAKKTNIIQQMKN